MAKRAKSISVSQLRSAAQKAAEHAHKKHPSVNVPVEDLYIAPWITLYSECASVVSSESSQNMMPPKPFE